MFKSISRKELKVRSAILLFMYFGYYLFISGYILSFITLSLDPSAKIIPTWLLIADNCLLIVVSIVVIYPLLKESYINIKGRLDECFNKLFTNIIFMNLAIIVLSFIIPMFTKQDKPNNENILQESFESFPIMLIFGAVIFAPIVEEAVFRGGIFRTMRDKYNFMVSAFVSSFLFGFIHVMSSISTGDYLDCINIIIYFAMGFAFAKTYEDTGCIYLCMLMHFLNNFAVVIRYIIV